MLILGLNGSPNKNGNTKYLLENVLGNVGKLGADTAIIEVGEIISHSKHGFCTLCSKPCEGTCYKGTPLEDAFNLMKKADGIFFASPVYFGTMSGQLKAMFDKSIKLRREKAFYNKVASAIAIGASRHGGQETTIKALHDIMLVHGMIIVGDGYIEDDCGHHGVCGHAPAEKDQFALKRSEILSKRMIEVCKATTCLRNQI